MCHCETFAAHCALERPLSRVGESVCAHGPHLREGLAAVWTHVRLLASVNPGVTPQPSCCGETLGTVSTLIWPLSCMSAHMLFQIVAVPEAAAADKTAFRPIVVVAQLVVRQAFFRQETLSTLLTLIRLLMINSLVVLERTDARESLITVPASETMVGAIGELVFTQLMVPQQVGHLEGLSTMRTLVFCQQLDALMSDSLVQGPEI